MIVKTDSSGEVVRRPAAITIGHTVSLGEISRPSEALIEHEFTHVLQYKILGFNTFVLIYGADQLWGWGVEDKGWTEAYEDQSLEEWATYVDESETYEPGQNPSGSWFEKPDGS